MDLRIRIVRVDGYGYTGRDPHPQDWMIGMVGTVVRLTMYAGERELGVNDFTYRLLGDPEVFTILDVMLDNGQTVQAMLHEVDIFKE